MTVATAKQPAHLSTLANTQPNSDLYEDESGDSMETADFYSKKSVGGEVRKLEAPKNDMSNAELSDSNARSDFDFSDRQKGELIEVKRKKFSDPFLGEASSSIHVKKNENEFRKDVTSSSSKHQQPKPKPAASSTSKTESENKDSKMKTKNLEKQHPTEKLEKDSKSEKKNLEVYCICKSADSTRFMM